MGCLYQLTSPSGKSYIGISSKTAADRFAKHVEHALGKRQNGVIYSALRKYGPAAFDVKTLVIANDFQYLCDLEVKAIAAFGTRYPSGYNMTDGGEGSTGPKGPGFAEKVSIAQKKRYERPEERARLANAALKGHETNRRRHEANRIDGRPPWVQRKRASQAREGSPEHKAKSSAAIKAALARPEVSAKVKKCALERAANPEWRKKIGDAKRGKKYGPRSSEDIKKQVTGILAAWADPEKKARRIDKNRATRAVRYPPVTLVCQECCEPFNLVKWKAEQQPKQKFCSRQCFYQSRRRK
jgi:hypothetical protein